MNLRILVCLSAVSLLPVACQKEKKSAKKSDPPKEATKEDEATSPQKKRIMNIPAGAVITDLTLPYHSKQKKKISLMTIKEVTVGEDSAAGATLLAGKNLKLWHFDDNGAIRSITTIDTADYLVEEEKLEATGEILMIGADKKFAAKSNGGVFSLATGQALLLGPATTRFEIPQKKSQPSK